jgi:heme/copper-type cytochrome/quinol oxidase subunit 2
MNELIQYDFKNTYKFIFKNLCNVIGLTILMALYGKFMPDKILDSFLGKFITFVFPTVIATILLFVLIYIVKDFRKIKYHEEEKLFSPTISGYKVLTSKLVVSIIWFFVYNLTYRLFDIICTAYLYKAYSISEILEMLIKRFGTTWQSVVIFIFTNLLFAMVFLLVAYFAMSLARESTDGELDMGWIKGYFLMYLIYLVGFYIIAFFNKSLNLSESGLKAFDMDVIGFEFRIRLGSKIINFFSMGCNKIIGDGHISLNAYIYIIVLNILLFWRTGKILNDKMKLKNVGQ